MLKQLLLLDGTVPMLAHRAPLRPAEISARQTAHPTAAQPLHNAVVTDRLAYKSLPIRRVALILGSAPTQVNAPENLSSRAARVNAAWTAVRRQDQVIVRT
jgi:hypothetical protein